MAFQKIGTEVRHIFWSRVFSRALCRLHCSILWVLIGSSEWLCLFWLAAMMYLYIRWRHSSRFVKCCPLRDFWRELFHCKMSYDLEVANDSASCWGKKFHLCRSMNSSLFLQTQLWTLQTPVQAIPIRKVTKWSRRPMLWLKKRLFLRWMT